MTRRRLWAIGIILGLAFVIGGPLLSVLSSDVKPEPAAPSSDLASQSASRFLDNYVDPDGRVVRRDQGNDTVSEGQAYAMLVAAAVGDRQRFDSAWRWSKDNLQQPNGLFAWKWLDGRVIDPEPATDADLDMARALVVASQRFGERTFADEARSLGRAIVKQTIAKQADGAPVLLAGPWAKPAPHVINPSYHSPRAEAQLAELMADSPWREVSENQRRIIDVLDGTPEAPKLPPDWASVSSDGTVVASGSPDGKFPPRYSWDAARTPIRLAESCNPADRDQAAQMWRVLNKSRQSRGAIAFSLEGEVQDRTPRGLGFVAAASAAKAASDEQQSTTLLGAADSVEAERPTYYGAAWAALGRIMLTTEWLGSCPR